MATDPRTTPPADAMRELMRLIPSYLGPSYIDDQFDEHKNPEFINPMPKPHAIADAGGNSSPVMMEIAKLMAEDQIPRPERIDLSSMPGARGRGEVNRMDLSRPPADFEPQVVNRDAKRDREDIVAETPMGLGIAREALGQALLLGQGDDIEAYLTGRQADDIKRERHKFADDNMLTSNAAYLGGFLGGGAAARALKALGGAAKPMEELDNALPPRFEPDLRQAMRNVEGIESSAKPADDTLDALQRLLSNPQSRADIQGKPMELSPADILMMTAGAAPGAGPVGTPENPVPQTEISEHDLSGLSPVDRLRGQFELNTGSYLTEDEKRKNASETIEAGLGMTPVIGNAMSAEDAYDSGSLASDAFREGNTRAGLMHSALAALSGVGAVTGLPIGKAAKGAARGASSRAGVFVPAWDDVQIKDVLSRRMDDQPLRDIYRDTGAFIDPGGKVLREIPDAGMTPGMGNFKPGDTATLGEYVDHPIFDVRPQYRDIATHFTDKRDSPLRGLSPVYRTTPAGDFEISLAPGDPRKGVAKLLQYQIAKDENLPAAMRHEVDIPETMRKATMDFKSVTPGGIKDLDALAAYVDKMTMMRDEMMGNLKMADPKRVAKVKANTYESNAGNVNARAVAGRAAFEDAPNYYPYQRRVPYINRSRALPEYQDIWTIPPEGSSADDLMEFLRNWRQFGSGRPSGEGR